MDAETHREHTGFCRRVNVSPKKISTPSTVCGESEASFQTDISCVPTPVVNQITCTLPCADSRMNVGYRLYGFTKGPFIFPNVTGSNKLSKPICIICRDELLGGQVCQELKTCGHCFHGACFDSFADTHSRCPVCRVRFKPSKS